MVVAAAVPNMDRRVITKDFEGICEGHEKCLGENSRTAKMVCLSKHGNKSATELRGPRAAGLLCPQERVD
jgi:hypothetical protein